jgi:hypothetical protein
MNNPIDKRAEEIQDEITHAIRESVSAELLNAQGFREACFKAAVLEMKLRVMERELAAREYERKVAW